ncbi:hypothetical protein EV385_6627 [Krasilnikovia cinnamomea]|uniref:Uncharacterized protein n=1 Tax=Krasilnikovia cinnamomea TaxID=349313 RepID=A0A4Q7Z9L7_9ACTN|nr:hypothetical protein [Krasilnikovia cinnamomea]RZU46553.1 hypothetical protein EV385_6627 [Krasilnikovia cinnamomea]
MSGSDVIVAALAAGASAGITSTATSAVQDAYAGLKKLLRPWLRGQAREALEADETEPGVWQALIGGELDASGATQDGEVVAAAERLLVLADPTTARTFNITVSSNNGVVAGVISAPVTIHHPPGPPAAPATA